MIQRLVPFKMLLRLISQLPLKPLSDLDSLAKAVFHCFGIYQAAALYAEGICLRRGCHPGSDSAPAVTRSKPRYTPRAFDSPMITR